MWGALIGDPASPPPGAAPEPLGTIFRYILRGSGEELPNKVCVYMCVCVLRVLSQGFLQSGVCVCVGGAFQGSVFPLCVCD